MIDELFPKKHKQDSEGPGPNTAWAAEIASSPSNGEVYVKIPGFSSTLRFGPCPYMPKATSGAPDEPSRGDDALVVFDDNNDPWVVCWTAS